MKPTGQGLPDMTLRKYQPWPPLRLLLSRQGHPKIAHRFIGGSTKPLAASSPDRGRQKLVAWPAADRSPPR